MIRRPSAVTVSRLNESALLSPDLEPTAQARVYVYGVAVTELELSNSLALHDKS